MIISKIKIVDKINYNTKFFGLSDDVWEDYSKLDNGRYIEMQDSFKFETTDGLKIIIYKNDVVFDNDIRTRYLTEITDIEKNTILLVDKLKANNRCYLIQGFFHNSFEVQLDIIDY